MNGFHQPSHPSLLRTILAVNAQALRLCDEVTAPSAPRELDDRFSDGIGLVSTRLSEFSERFLSLLIQPDRNRFLHLVNVSQLYDVTASGSQLGRPVS